MKTIIQWLFGIFWTIMTALSVYLAYSAFQVERDPRLIWAWLVMCGAIFLSVTWLTYNVFCARHKKPGATQHNP